VLLISVAVTPSTSAARWKRAGTARDAAEPEASYQDQGQYAGDTREDLTGREGIQGTDTSGPTT
jgi:hypothetical protein